MDLPSRTHGAFALTRGSSAVRKRNPRIPFGYGRMRGKGSAGPPGIWEGSIPRFGSSLRMSTFPSSGCFSCNLGLVSRGVWFAAAGLPGPHPGDRGGAPRYVATCHSGCFCEGAFGCVYN